MLRALTFVVRHAERRLTRIVHITQTAVSEVCQVGHPLVRVVLDHTAIQPIYAEEERTSGTVQRISGNKLKKMFRSTE